MNWAIKRDEEITAVLSTSDHLAYNCRELQIPLNTITHLSSSIYIFNEIQICRKSKVCFVCKWSFFLFCFFASFHFSLILKIGKPILKNKIENGSTWYWKKKEVWIYYTVCSEIPACFLRVITDGRLYHFTTFQKQIRSTSVTFYNWVRFLKSNIWSLYSTVSEFLNT